MSHFQVFQDLDEVWKEEEPDQHESAFGEVVKTALCKVRWSGYDRTGDTWEPITHLQGYANMVKAFNESHEKDVESLAADRQREAESKEAHALKNAPNHTVVCMKGLTSPVWTLGMFQMVTVDSCQCMKRTKQSTVCDITVRHVACTVSGCGFVVKRLGSATDGRIELSLTFVAPAFTADKKSHCDIQFVK
jgi:hypothetical protein